MYETLLRDNIRKLKPYSTARDEFSGMADVFLDANENPYDFTYHRYPDPYQHQLKAKLSITKEIPIQKIFLGNGSDEIIDLLIRAFCEPYQDSIVSINPSYGMYKVSADKNGIGLRQFPLFKDFSLDVQALVEYFRPNDKLLFLCSPNNPSGNSIPLESIKIICKAFRGLVIVDEAYIDFSSKPSAIELLENFPQLIILQTFSKAMASAGLRIGIGMMSEQMVQILNNIKPPYNISQAAQDQALELLDKYEIIKDSIEEIKKEREQLINTLGLFPFVKYVFPTDANFILIRVDDAFTLYHYLLKNGIIVRDRSKQLHCENCLRITVGTPPENIKLVNSLSEYL